MKFHRTSAQVCALLLIAALAACGGGGGGGATTPGPATAARTVVAGTASAGVFSGADVLVYDARSYSGPSTSTALASAATNASGAYRATLPDGFAGTLLIRVVGRADGTSSVKDEVFGATPVTDSFVLESVVPASLVGPAGGRVTAHVTAYTHAMALYVARKLGRADVDAAVVAARSHVTTKLTGGADPLTTLPTRADMVAHLASASNIANASTSTFRNDPYACSVKATNADKIACTLRTVAAVLQPLAHDAAASAVPELNLGYASALSGAARSLDVARAAANSEVPADELASAHARAMAALDTTETEALVESVRARGVVALPLIGYITERGSRLLIASGPQAGEYVGWHYRISKCIGDTGTACPDFSINASVTPEDVLEDPDLIDAADRAAAELTREIDALQMEVYSKERVSYPSAEIFANAVSAAFPQGLQAQSVAVAMSAARANLAAAGFPVEPTTATPGEAATATPEQLTAANACTAPEAYVNPSAPDFDPQLDSNCRLAQVNACLHRAGFPQYDPQGRAACQIVNGLIEALSGQGNTFSCSYCSPNYPF